MTRIVCLGIAVLDRVYEVEAIPSDPVKVAASDYRETGGGMAATAAVAVSALGGTAEFWGRLGTDAVGDVVLEAMSRHGVDISNVDRAPGSRSPTAAVLVEPGGERLLAVFTGRGLRDDVSWLPLNALAGAGAVLGDGRWTAGCLALFEAARARGIPSVLDADIVPRETLAPLVKVASATIFSERGLAAYAEAPDPSRGLAWVAQEADGIVGVTLGARGVLWREGKREQHVPAFPIVAHDTTGAGDVFHGAYALALAEGRGPQGAVRFASAAAALKCARGRGWDGMPDRAAVDEMLMEGPHAALGG